MNRIKAFLIKFWNITKNAAQGFSDDRAVKLSGSLAYSTIFSLPPMLLLIIIFGGTFYGQDALRGTIFTELKDIVGTNTALQIQNIIKGLQYQKSSVLATIVGALAMIIGATGIFVEIQGSLNMIWGVRPKTKKGFLKLILNRLISFSMIIGLGFLLIVSLIINTLVLALSRQLLQLFPAISLYMLNLINTGIIFFVLSFLFSVIFKMLPDVRLKWREVWPGAFLTTLLFLLGKFVIGLYIGYNQTISLYGAASSVIVLLLWIYFSAIILYFGAEFTRAYIESKGHPVQPNNYAELDEKRLWEAYQKSRPNPEPEGPTP